MVQFYASIILIGVILIVFALVWIAVDRKKSIDYKNQLDDKKDDLIKVIVDSEQMLEELNKFSDFIVTQVDMKYKELGESIKVADEKIKHISVQSLNTGEQEGISQSVKEVASEPVELKAVHEVKNSGGNVVDIQVKPHYENQALSDDILLELVNNSTNISSYTSQKSSTRKNEKVIPLNIKHREVMNLADRGMNETEIAKTLNMGKGEIQLILGMNARRLKSGT